MRRASKLKLLAEAADTLAAFIARRGGISEGDARAAIERGGAFLRGRRTRSADAQVKPGDRVEVSLKPREGPEPLGRERVLHLDALVLVVDKPAGVTAQEDLEGGPALPDLCSALLKTLGERETQALLVHRLDRGTTGVTVLARTGAAQAALLEEFREHRVDKEYRALVRDAPASADGLIDLPLGPSERGLRKADLEGEPARTRFRVLERYDGASLVAAFPETGRTHQVRVHLRELGCPLLGDTRYGGPAFVTRADGARIDFERPLLHALRLALRHPDGTRLELIAAPPADFETARAFLHRSR